MAKPNGQKIVSAIQQFNSKVAISGKTPIELLALTMQKRTLGDKHFTQADNFFSSLRKAIELPIFDQYTYNNKVNLSEKEIQLFSIYMSVIQKDNGKPKHNEYSPSLIKGIVKNDLISFVQRPLPMIFSANHIEDRFSERAKKELNYSGNEFIYTMQAGLMLATVVPEYMSKNNINMTPVLVPDTDGFYIGYATEYNHTSHYPKEFLLSIARNEKENTAPLAIGLEPGVKTEPAWSPNSTIKIQTFISKNEFKPDQQELDDKFDKLINTQKTEDAYTSLINSYAHCLPDIESSNSNLAYLRNSFNEIINSDIWKKVCKYGERHMPRSTNNNTQIKP